MTVASEFVWLSKPQPFYELGVPQLDAVLGKSESQMAWLSCSHVGIASLYSMIQQTVDTLCCPCWDRNCCGRGLEEAAFWRERSKVTYIGS